MGFLDRYRQAPPSASGRMRHDVTLGLGGVALTGLWALSGAIRRMSAPPENDRTIALTVADRRVVAHDQDVIALTLVGEQLPRWHPGAHIDIHLPSGLVRQYSLCGDPGSPDTYRIAVRRIPDGGGGSIEMHDLRVGATVTTHGPRNAFPLTVPGYGSPARRFRFIAGGIGITPILPMLTAIRSALAHRLHGAPAATPVAVIGANCSPVGSTATTADGATAYCSTLQTTGASIWSLTPGDVPGPTVTAAPTEAPLLIEGESPVRVCIQQTGRTRLACRQEIRRSNLGLP